MRHRNIKWEKGHIHRHFLEENLRCRSWSLQNNTCESGQKKHSLFESKTTGIFLSFTFLRSTRRKNNISSSRRNLITVVMTACTCAGVIQPSQSKFCFRSARRFKCRTSRARLNCFSYRWYCIFPFNDLSRSLAIIFLPPSSCFICSSGN